MKHLAFLRAINVGGHTVKMDRLKELFEGLGLADIETFIASGNVIYTADRRSPATMEKAIEDHLEAELGYAVTTFIRTPAELANAAAHRPFPKVKLVGRDVVWMSFLKKPLDAEQKKGLAAVETEIERFATKGRELYWLRRLDAGAATITPAQLARALKKADTTARNLTTINKLVAKYC